MERMAEIKENNELLREKYMNALRELQIIYDNGGLALNQRTLEKVELYLQKEKILQIANKNHFEEREKEVFKEKLRQKRIV